MKSVTDFDTKCTPSGFSVKRFEESLKGAHPKISIRLEMKALDKLEVVQANQIFFVVNSQNVGTRPARRDTVWEAI